MNSRDTIPIGPTTNQVLFTWNATADDFRDSSVAPLPQNDKGGLHETAYCVVVGPCLDRLVKHKNEYKQVPVNDSCVKTQSYHRDCIYGSGPGIVLNP